MGEWTGQTREIGNKIFRGEMRMIGGEWILGNREFDDRDMADKSKREQNGNRDKQ